MSLWRAVLLLLSSGACTQNFDVFVSKDAGEDAPATDSSVSGDVSTADVAATCNPPPSCLSSASACGESCLSGYTGCVDGCGTSETCESLCKSQEQTCDATCVTICEGCFDAGCAPTQCQSALPP